MTAGPPDSDRVNGVWRACSAFAFRSVSGLRLSASPQRPAACGDLGTHKYVTRANKCRSSFFFCAWASVLAILDILTCLVIVVALVVDFLK
jgi:hypothetical protein